MDQPWHVPCFVTLVVIVDNPTLRVEWLATERIIKKTAIGFVVSDVLRPALDALAARLEMHRATSLLSDMRKMWPTSHDDIRWIGHDWMPRMRKAGWRTWAVIEPESPLGRMSLRRWLSACQQHGIVVQTFRDEAAALAWLRELEPAAAAEASPQRSSAPP